MLMDEDRGVFNLFIMNLSLEDDAEFQCQVSPAVTPIIHKLIRSSANLTVLCKYTFYYVINFFFFSKIVYIVQIV